MRLVDCRPRFAVAILALLGAVGCRNGSPGLLPAGPGVATHGDLRPWLASAKEAKRFGRLMEFNVPSELGSYDTWGLAATVTAQSVEVDVRACPGAAEDFNDKLVVVTGKLIARNERHLPLLVAERIVPANDHGNELPHSARHVEMAPEPDPVTGQFDSTVEFQASQGTVPIVEAAN
ncbi:MAG: hypothetical protein ABSB74_01575 [Tepidisphaeraceae bacterium]|jgi:hypothetical protein